MGNDYKKTMNLPVTEFPMRASLATREPERLAAWEEQDIYRKVLEARAGAPTFVLHDGPPYANGHIHMGTTYNKIVKDLIVKYKSMRGYCAPYVPGWDCHGQPIEHMVEKELGPVKMAQTSQPELRSLCRDWATRFIDVQRAEFKRLGVRGDWDDPYLTYLPEYEAGNVEVFKALYEAGAIYRGRKPIHWCKRCHTALAEAEIEYADERSHSLYVAFSLDSVPEAFASAGLPASILIWTTTPWTLPANVAVSLAPDADYVAVVDGDRVLVMAEALVGSVATAAGWDEPRLVVDASGEPVRVKGEALAGLTYAHPVHDGREGVVILGDHVELTAGTGAVHTAPGHGDEDYLVGLKYDLPMPMPVDDDGVFDQGGGPFAGMSIDDANPAIVAWLSDKGALVASGSIEHSYPHCWRCKQPVIYRATDQWFVSMSTTGLQEAAVSAIQNDVRWYPSWSINRISAMVADRPDWCISRQRAWGVPVPVFRCTECDETVATPETFDAVIELFEREGADAWFRREPSEYLPENTACSRCGSTSLRPESDILDVWWESGVSHTSVLKKRDGLVYPADLYLEGSDQHRGWFQSSLLTSVGAYGRPPYDAVLTHGFVVDGDGRKMSKSLGNVISPMDLIGTYGADIMRLWMASSDYAQDIAVSAEILDRTSEAYRRIRNTFRFLLGNLDGFDPAVDSVAVADMPELDRQALAALKDLLERTTTAYDEYRFHAVYRAVYDYVNDLSSVYMDVLKDRLYSDGRDWESRRSAQTVLSRILDVLVRILAPILTFTCDEVWDHLPASMRTAESVQLALWPALDLPTEVTALRVPYETVYAVRDVVTKALEEARNAGVVGKSQEAHVHIVAPADVVAVLEDRGTDLLAELFITASVSVEAGEATSAHISAAEGEKCPRCWNIRALGVDASHPDVCARCAAVLSEAGA